ncbi:MAG: hypothetical protein KAU62_13850 [Candidatus Heimdallarchaeota archaeon]|nr:hypothetical protein [Candidatus Heimdallarchaeota archaeon]MCG3257174.1 hypothetical protein [Candidatus Heimdallarchaeota archaeon]MCK4612234.1 hypothetical protein [Candidatus Heimdallarchaeota archaeon]
MDTYHWTEGFLLIAFAPIAVFFGVIFVILFVLWINKKRREKDIEN